MSTIVALFLKAALTLAVFSVLFLSPVSYSSKQLDVIAACTMTFAYAMDSPDGTETWMIFNETNTQISSPVGGVKIGSTRKQIVSVAGKPFAVAKYPKITGGFSFTFSRNTIGSSGDCGGASTNSIAYDASKDPYSTVTDRPGYEIYFDTDNKAACREKVNGPFRTLSECEAQAAITNSSKWTAAVSQFSVICVQTDRTDVTPLYNSKSECEAAKSSLRFTVATASDGTKYCVVDPNGSYTSVIDCKVGAEKSVKGENPCSADCVTALGTIPATPIGFATKVLSIALGLAGGIALIILVMGSIKIILSSGDQQKLQNGREMIIAAIAGLLFIIFSILILQAIGNNIIGIPLN